MLSLIQSHHSPCELSLRAQPTTRGVLGTNELTKEHVDATVNPRVSIDPLSLQFQFTPS